MDLKLYPQPGDVFPAGNTLRYKVTAVAPGLVWYEVQADAGAVRTGLLPLASFLAQVDKRKKLV